MSAAPVSVESDSRQPRRRTKEDTAARFQELTSRNRQLRDRVTELEQENGEMKRVNGQMRQQLEERFARRAELLRRAYPDFDEILLRSFVPDFIVPELHRLDYGPDVAYLLGKTAHLCREMADMRPQAAIRKLHEVSAFVEQQQFRRPQK